MSGYHKRKIQKGTLGKVSKIKEEYEEFLDSIEQKNDIMALLELSDLIGAIEAYVKKYNMTLKDVIKMKEATKKAFESGGRISATPFVQTYDNDLEPFTKDWWNKFGEERQKQIDEVNKQFNKKKKKQVEDSGTDEDYLSKMKDIPLKSMI